jgi:hypothetical protein
VLKLQNFAPFWSLQNRALKIRFFVLFFTNNAGAYNMVAPPLATGGYFILQGQIVASSRNEGEKNPKTPSA